ncbi:MAG: hemerythrin domain-containing protein [Candidatus Sulfotelmatobacter sp.]
MSGAMLRDKNLIPLSRQHQHALALCVRIERASPVAVADLGVWQAEIAEIVQNEIRVHFAAEEHLVFPAALRFAELRTLVEELLGEHARLREDFAEAETRTLSPERLLGLARGLSSHIRKEERRLFERMQELMKSEELADLGARLEDALKDASQACALPNATTKLRGNK